MNRYWNPRLREATKLQRSERYRYALGKSKAHGESYWLWVFIRRQIERGRVPSPWIHCKCICICICTYIELENTWIIGGTRAIERTAFCLGYEIHRKSFSICKNYSARERKSLSPSPGLIN